MMACKQRVAVIGAGISGLAAIKGCLDEDLEPVCFERTSEMGGLWCYTDTPIDGQGCVMKSTVINTSKEMMSFSDFPVPDEFPVFMHNTMVYKYFKLYSDKFGLEKYIHYNTEVVSVSKAKNFPIHGQWQIKTRNRTTKEEKTEVYDFVMVCTGHHADKYVPAFPGLSDFKGKVLHSHDYRHPKGLEEKRILVVGIGNSGGDIAVETSRYASQVYLSTRQGTWIFHRVSDNGLPLDMLYTRRVMLWLGETFLFRLFNAVLKFKLNSRINHSVYCIQPNYGPLQQHPMVNDELPNRIISGRVQVRNDVSRFTETGVEFIDGTKEDNIDVVVLATGYSFGFPFIDKEVIDVQDNVVSLYKNTFIPDLERPTLAIIGCAQGFGAITPAVEMQSRAATRVFKREAFLPGRDLMWKDIKARHAYNARRYAKSRRHTIQVEIIEFMDSLAELAGCSLNFWHLICTDPILAFKVIFSSSTPYQFRLYGARKWEGARNAIMTQWQRVYVPLKTRPLDKQNGGFLLEGINLLFWAILVVPAYLFLLIFFL